MAAKDACARCAAPDDLNEMTITDDSGGSFILLCDSCRDHIDTRRCQVCGSRMVAQQKADSLFFMDDWGTAFEICDGCRTELIFAPRKVEANG